MKRYIKANQEIDIEEYVRQSFQGSEPGTGCTFIDAEGNYINIYPKLDVHEDLCEWVEDQLNIKLPYKDEEFFVREFNWIRLRSDPRLTIIELPSNTPSNSQWYALEDWLYYIEDKHPSGVTIYLEVCDKEASTPYEFMKAGFTEDLIKLLKRFYSSGKLYASRNISHRKKRIMYASSNPYHQYYLNMFRNYVRMGRPNQIKIVFEDKDGFVSSLDEKQLKRLVADFKEGKRDCDLSVKSQFTGAKYYFRVE